MKTKEYEKDLISCIVPTYKRSDSLLRAVESILNQTYTKFEVLVVDDNEPNDAFSLEVQEKLNSITDERVRYLQQERHINGAAARNFGINHAKGEYIALLDDDDEWLPEKLEKQIKALKELDSSYGAVTSLVHIYNNGEKVRTSPPYTEENLHKKVLEHSVSIFTDTVLFRKSHLDKAGYFNESLQRHQDLQLFTDFLAHFKMKPMNIPLVVVHTDDASNRPDTKKLIHVKERFFEEMQDNLDMYSKKEQRDIKSSHYFEVIFIALKERKIGYIFRYLAKIGLNFSAYNTLLQRIMDRRN